MFLYGKISKAHWMWTNEEKRREKKSKSLEYNRLILALSNRSPSPSKSPYIWYRLSSKNQSNFSWVQCFAKKIDGTVDGFHYYCPLYVLYIYTGIWLPYNTISAVSKIKYAVRSTHTHKHNMTDCILLVCLCLCLCERACEYGSTQTECDNRNSVVMKKWT